MLVLLFKLVGYFLMLIQIHNQQVNVVGLETAATSTAVWMFVLSPVTVLIKTGTCRGTMSVLGTGVPLRTEVTFLNMYLLVISTQHVELITTTAALLVLIEGLWLCQLARDTVSGLGHTPTRVSAFPKLDVDVLSQHTFCLLDI